MTTELGDTLVFSWGNPSRGDDALGPAMHQALISDAPGRTECLTDFQLQVEHSLDLQHRSKVVFVDASVSGAEPFEFRLLKPQVELSYTTHALSPSALLGVFSRVQGHAPPPAWLLSIRGYHFDLGQPISAAAQRNLDQSFQFLCHWLADSSPHKPVLK